MKKRFLPFLMALSIILPTFSAFAEEVTPETETNQTTPAVIAETDLRLAPVFHILAYIYVKAVGRPPAGRAAGAVKIIFAAMGENEGIADIYFSQFHTCSPQWDFITNKGICKVPALYYN